MQSLAITTRGRVAPHKSRQRGAVAIVVGITMFVMVGMAGLALDLGHLFVIRTELQNAADACALSAARELNGASDSLLRAENSGITVGQSNFVDFQKTAVSVASSDVTFSDTLNGAYLSRGGGASPTTSHYARCSLALTGIEMWFMRLFGIDTRDVGAMAVAGLGGSQSSCALPIGICLKSTASTCTGGGTPDAFGLCAGDWVGGRFGAGGGLTGSFNWIDFSPPAGGANEVSDLLRGAGQCNLTVNWPVGQAGVMGNAAARAFNTRFGLYQGSDGPTAAVPDLTGYSYTTTVQGQGAWPAQRNAYNDFLSKQVARQPYQGDAATGLTLGGGYSALTSAQHNQYGSLRRVALAPVVDCGAWASAQTVPIQGWACILMLHPIASPGDDVNFEYLGDASLATSICSYGLPSGSGSGSGPQVPTLVQ